LNVGSVAYDPYNAQSLGEELTKEGVLAIRMAQNCTQFNEPIREFLQCVTDGRVRHDGNPLLRWAANNAAISKDRSDRWMFDKRSSGEKIDPIVACVMAFRVCSLAPARPSGSLYIS
jgi:phage terminase large subunit-like protein